MSQTFKLSTSLDFSYPYEAGEDLWDSFRRFCGERYAPSRLLLAIDENVDDLHGETLRRECGKQFGECVTAVIPEGEWSKSVEEWRRLTDALMESAPERNTPLLAVGGGVTGDLAGFAASTLLRGIPLIHMPTTLLAMVDSSVGGKTGVNHAAGKNLVGSFYQPDAVFAQLRFLQTLPEEEWVNGLAEMLKYAAIRRPELFEELRLAVSEGFGPSDLWSDLVFRSARIKAEIVEEDMLESGSRAFLNFGHTYAHALEKIAGYGNISHGEAVFLGMIAATRASEELGAPVDPARFGPFLSLYRAPYDRYSERTEELMEAMKRDKKVKEKELHLVLLDRWGEPRLQRAPAARLVEESWNYAFRMVTQTAE